MSGAFELAPQTAVARPATGGRASLRRELWLAVLVGVVSVAVAYLRVPAGSRAVTWAEDGTRFLTGPLSASWPGQTLLTPYGGYLHLLPRLTGAILTNWFPISWWGQGMTAAASLWVGAGAGAVFALSRPVVDWLPARLAVAVVMVLSPMANVEALGNVANLHWFAGYLMPWLLLGSRGGRGAQALWAGVALAVAMTEPQTLLFAPLALWVWVRRPGTRVVVAAYGVGLLAQGFATAQSPRPAVAYATAPSSVAEGFGVNAALSNFTTDPRVLGEWVLSTNWGAAWGAIAFFLLCAVVAWRYGRAEQRAFVAAAVFGAVGSWSASFYVNQPKQLDYARLPVGALQQFPLARWGTTAALLLASLVPLACAGLARRTRSGRPAAGRLRRHGPGWLLASATLVFLAVMTLSWRPPVLHRLGPTWAAGVRTARAECDGQPDGTAKVPEAPRGWVVLLPCSALLRS